jgi:hypothetical protein
VTEPQLGEPVTAAFIENGRTVNYNFFHSWTQLLGYDMGNQCRIWRGSFIDIRCGTDGLVDGRNQAVEQFLTDRKAEWLWWIDTDMGFAPDTVDRLLEAADPVQRPIVGALCFASIEKAVDGMGGWSTVTTPTVFDWAQDGDAEGFAVRWDYPANTLVRCVGTGSACILIHRSVFEKMLTAAAAEPKFGAWYDRRINPSTGQRIAEDLSFCVRAAALDIPVYVHTGVPTTHAKPAWLGEQAYWQHRAVNPAPWKPEPKTEPANA